jgi:hypothetical protein
MRNPDDDHDTPPRWVVQFAPIGWADRDNLPGAGLFTERDDAADFEASMLMKGQITQSPARVH